jgi:hypothetical protein
MRKPGFRDGYFAMKLYELRRDDDLRDARDMVGREIFLKSWEEVKPLLSYDHPHNARLRQVVGYWELAASLVMRGILHPDVYLDVCDEGLFTYAVLEESLPKIREIRPTFFQKTDAAIQEHPKIKGRLMEIRTRIFKARKERQPNIVRD